MLLRRRYQGRRATILDAQELEVIANNHLTTFRQFVLVRGGPDGWEIPPGPLGIFPGIATAYKNLGMFFPISGLFYDQTRIVLAAHLGEALTGQLAETADSDERRGFQLLLVLWSPKGKPRVFKFSHNCLPDMALQMAILGPINPDSLFQLAAANGNPMGNPISLMRIGELNFGGVENRPCFSFPTYRAMRRVWVRQVEGGEEAVQEGIPGTPYSLSLDPRYHNDPWHGWGEHEYSHVGTALDRKRLGLAMEWFARKWGGHVE